jgi:hypothetical protein
LLAACGGSSSPTTTTAAAPTPTATPSPKHAAYQPPSGSPYSVNIPLAANTYYGGAFFGYQYADIQCQDVAFQQFFHANTVKVPVNIPLAFLLPNGTWRKALETIDNKGHPQMESVDYSTCAQHPANPVIVTPPAGA